MKEFQYHKLLERLFDAKLEPIKLDIIEIKNQLIEINGKVQKHENFISRATGIWIGISTIVGGIFTLLTFILQ